MGFEIKTGTVKTERYKIEYFSFGKGERPFVIIPGMWMRSMIPSAKEIAADYSAFGEKYKVYFIERKNEMEYGYMVPDMAEDTADVMKRFGLHDVYLFGISQGGAIAQLVAARYPELVSKLVLGSTNMRPNATTEAVFSRWMSLARIGNTAELNRDAFSKIYSNEYYEKYREEFEFLEKQGTAEELKRFSVLAKACLMFDSTEETKKIKCPTLVIGAGNDRIMTAEASREIAGAIGCELYVYEGASHAVYDEAEDYKARVLEFLERH